MAIGRDRRLTAAQRGVLVVAIEHIDNPTGKLRISQQDLADKAGVDRKTVRAMWEDDAPARSYVARIDRDAYGRLTDLWFRLDIDRRDLPAYVTLKQRGEGWRRREPRSAVGADSSRLEVVESSYEKPAPHVVGADSSLDGGGFLPVGVGADSSPSARALTAPYSANSNNANRSGGFARAAEQAAANDEMRRVAAESPELVEAIVEFLEAQIDLLRTRDRIAAAIAELERRQEDASNQDAIEQPNQAGRSPA